MLSTTEHEEDMLQMDVDHKSTYIDHRIISLQS